jgi:hypothetical protein
MATPNFQYEKRKRDLEKKAKKEAKRLKKLEKPDGSEGPAIIEQEVPEPETDEIAAVAGSV